MFTIDNNNFNGGINSVDITQNSEKNGLQSDTRIRMYTFIFTVTKFC